MPVFGRDEAGPGYGRAAGWAAHPHVCSPPAQPLWAADAQVPGPIGAVKLARNPAPREVWTQGCSLLILSQQTRRLRARVAAGAGLAGAPGRAVRCHSGRARKGNDKWHELTAESLCLSQAACKGKCKFSNQFFPVLCSIVQKLSLALCPGESKCSFPHLSFTQSNPVFL